MSKATPNATVPAFRARAGQVAFERFVELHRISAFVARRQYGKTTSVARIALKKMMRQRDHTVIFGSVKVDLGREIVRKESGEIQKAIRLLIAQAAKAKLTLDVVNSEDATKSGAKSVLAVDADAWAALYEQQRLEFRLWHDRSSYSRTKVVALTPDAVGETGDVILDEVGRAKRFREVVEAMLPIIAANPEFRCIFTTTPPPDDTHYSFELLAPPIAAEFPVNPDGNTYVSDLKIPVLRLDAFDAYADGVPLYDDDTGAALSPAEHRARASDKDAWDRNYGVKFVVGGTSACGLVQLDTAQRRGIGECQLFRIEDDLGFEVALRWLFEKITAGPVGLGFDVATTTKGTSNPSALAVIESRGIERIVRAVFVWKTADPAIATERVRQVVTTIGARKEGGAARRLCIDATGERYFAQALRQQLGSLLPVELVIASETIEIPGEPEPITRKQVLGGKLVGHLDDNHLLLPPERYLREDFRLVKKEKGQFVCEPDADGRHGDTFDAVKLAEHALTSTAGGMDSVAGITIGHRRAGRAAFKPRRLRG